MVQFNYSFLKPISDGQFTAAVTFNDGEKLLLFMFKASTCTILKITSAIAKLLHLSKKLQINYCRSKEWQS